MCAADYYTCVSCNSNMEDYCPITNSCGNCQCYQEPYDSTDCGCLNQDEASCTMESNCVWCPAVVCVPQQMNTYGLSAILLINVLGQVTTSLSAWHAQTSSSNGVQQLNRAQPIVNVHCQELLHTLNKVNVSV